MTITRYSRYDDRESPERPVRLDKTEGYVIIEGRVYPARELVEALAQSGYTEIRTEGDSLVLGRRRITPIFKSRQERAMASLCHGSLAFCCPLNKRCADRDRALEILGLSRKEYENLKGDAHGKFIDAARGLYDSDSQGGRRDIRSRTATRPAVDRGFGSDDYRRDFDELDKELQEPDESQSRVQKDWYSESTDRHIYDDLGPPQQEAHRSNIRELKLRDEMTSAVQEASSASSCQLGSEEIVDGLASLFSQGELSPFKADSEHEDRRPSFCFACGRTIERGVSRCPFCGSTQ